MTDITKKRQKEKNRTKELTVTGLMTAVLCILGPLSIPLPFSPVPISLTNFVLYTAVYILGMKRTATSCLIYLCLGTAGLPVFSGFSGGLGKLAGPTGGYLIGFLFLALIQGFFMERFPGKSSAAVIGMILGTAVCYTFGTAWLSWQMHLTFGAALAVGVIPYLPADAVKMILSAVAGPQIAARISRL